MRLRPALLTWHRWFGLAAALWLFLLGLTGSVLVFYGELDRALNPGLWQVEARGEPLPTGALVARVEAAKPGAYVSYVTMPDGPGRPAVLSVDAKPGSGLTLPDYMEIFVDPHTGAILGERDWGAFRLDAAHLMPFLYQLHMDLHLGPWMVWVLGLVSFLWVFDHLAAAVLSFPSAAKWRDSFRIRRGAGGHKLTFDLHRSGGLWLFPVTLVLAVSGLYFNWHEEFKAAVNLASPVTPRPDARAPALPEPLISAPVGADRAIQVAREVAGGARVDSLVYNAAKGLWWVRLDDPRDMDGIGRRWVFVDARDGRVLADRHATDGSAGDVVLAWQYPLHSGKAFGWPGRILVLAAGVGVCVFSVTGILIWNRKRAARQASRRRAMGAVAAGRAVRAAGPAQPPAASSP